MRNGNDFCPYCLIVYKGRNKCGRCGNDTVSGGYWIRLPKKDASNRTWKKFFALFPNLLDRMPRTKKLVELGLQNKDKNV